MSTSARLVRHLGARHLAIACVLAASASRAHASSIVVHDIGGPTVSTCTLAQAINAANAASNINIFSYGSTSGSGSCSAAVDFSFDISFDPALPQTIALDSVDNYWYGPNALPPIATNIRIIGSDAGTTLLAVHSGDPTPDTTHAFRFFYVSGGLDGEIHDNAAQPVAGTLTLENIVLQGGYAKGGNSRYGGGGAGMGGAIFNQGTLKLFDVSLIGNVAQGGGYDPLGPDARYAGGGMGQDAQSGGTGGGFGGSVGNYGSAGGSGSVSGRGGGGGGAFVAFNFGSTAQTSSGAQGGGQGKSGGAGGSSTAGGPGGVPGDGGGGGGSSATGAGGGGGGGFGGGGGAGYGKVGSAAGGGGVGGGGGSYTSGLDEFADGGKFGFGGLGGSSMGADGLSAGGNGGFGGGGGGGGGPNSISPAAGGIGAGKGGQDPHSGGGGGAGMGGAIFNHRGSASLINVTAARNKARGGAGFDGGQYGSGLGAVIFNLNGSVAIEYSTMAANTLAGTNGASSPNSAEDGTVYSLTFANTVEDGSPNNATLSIHSSIIRAPVHDAGAGNAVVANRIDGDSPNPSTVKYWFTNFVASSTAFGTATTGGTGSADPADPLLLALTRFSAPDSALPVFPFRPASPAFNAAATCRLVDAAGNLIIGASGKLVNDARSVTRSYLPCDAGSYENDNDEIFPDDYEGGL
jgi:hypothetical protein